MKALTSKQIVIIVVIMIIAVIAFLMFQSRRWHEQERLEMIAFAESYVATTFEQEMVLVDYRGGWLTVLHRVYPITFSKQSNPDFVFEVRVSRNPDTLELQVRQDNFFEVLIRNGLTERYIPIVHSIWGDDTKVSVSVSRLLYRYVPDSLNEKSTVDDISYSNLNDRFGIFVDIPYFFTYESKDGEVEKVYQLIQILQEREYSPSWVHINRFSDASLSEMEFFWVGSVTSTTTLEDIKAEVERRWFLDE